MSQVISFRLNPENPREKQALEILQSRQGEGYSIRQVLTEALIRLAGENGPEASLSLGVLQITLEQMSELLEQMSKITGNGQEIQMANSQSLSLNDHFLTSVKMAAKPGMKLE